MRKTNFYVLALVLLLIGIAPTEPISAQETGPSASGHVNLDGTLLTVSFTAVTHHDGTVTGEMEFHDQGPIPDQDVDGTGEPGLSGSPSGVAVHAEVDCLLVEDKSAVIGGVVRLSSLPSYLGKSIVLAVEDNGEGSNDPPDGVTWGLYGAEDEVGCETFPFSAYSLFDIEGGNIQVRP